MEGITETVMFYILAVVIIGASVFAVVSRRIFRAAFSLLLVLICTAGLYLLLDYHFLAVVQLAVYAGGILILFIFAILLTSATGDRTEPHDKRRVMAGVVTAVAGLGMTTWATIKHEALYGAAPAKLEMHETDMKVVGKVLMGTDKYEYLLSFEMLSILLLICAIAGILIARKR